MEEVLISVIMSVYNADQKFLKEAIESILNQTYQNFEFIIIDDGSDENTKKVLNHYNDPRIRIIENDNNLGLTKSLNIALANAKGKYIARMDADDISYPQRLEKQLEYMEEHKEVGALGCWTSNNLNKKVNHWRGAIPSEYRKVEMLFGNSGICHPTSFIRLSVLNENNIKYNEEIKKAQDYELWVQLLRYCEIRVYPEILLLYRVHDNQITKSDIGQQEYYRNIIRKQLFYQVYPTGTDKEYEMFLNFANVNTTIGEMERLLYSLEQGNLKEKIYDERLFRFEMIRAWTEWIMPQFTKQNGFSVIFRKNIYNITERGYLFWRIKIYILMYF